MHSTDVGALLRHVYRGVAVRFRTEGLVQRCASAAVKIALDEGCALEMYDRARYFTVTGNPFRNAPLQVEDHAADVLALFEQLTQRRRAIPLAGKLPYGTQHLTLVSIAGTLRRRGICDEAIEACLQAVNHYQCEQPGPRTNITRIVTSTRPWSQRL